ncbi:hypothetical protein [Chryseobacterium joostei]|uniref:hypothetical protein n=1 Tax=Chryseobacterium joostei TaxID=112234 RepID=UPI0023F0CD49|nr:hypothetical protein [Chryseobacterium joostei]
MKKILCTSLLMLVHIIFAQTIIGDDIGTATDKTSVLLEFAAGQKKGIILPYTRTLPSGTGLAEGTLLLDVTNAAKTKVKYYNGTWQDLSSGNEADIASSLVSQPVVTEDRKQGVIIGASASTANGILILESSNKAMVLPQVNSTDDIINPAPGMMVYVNKTGAKRLAVFNGAKWTFWM